MASRLAYSTDTATARKAAVDARKAATTRFAMQIMAPRVVGPQWGLNPQDCPSCEGLTGSSFGVTHGCPICNFV